MAHTGTQLAYKVGCEKCFLHNSLNKREKMDAPAKFKTLKTLLATLRMHLGKGETQESEMFEIAALAAPFASSI